MIIRDVNLARNLIRLNKFLSAAGIASRRKADEMIASGKVRVNGKIVVNLGIKIDPDNDKIVVNEKQVALLDEPVYIVFNKPKDCITTSSDERGRTTVMNYISISKRVYPVGRLDRNTTGVLILTNDGRFANKLMHPRNQIIKAYKVTLDKAFNPEHSKKIKRGIRLSDGMTMPAELYLFPGEKSRVVGIGIREGRNKQVHRMFNALGYEVQKLDRVSYAGISYEGLPRGRWRYLTGKEVRKLEETI